MAGIQQTRDPGHIRGYRGQCNDKSKIITGSTTLKESNEPYLVLDGDTTYLHRATAHRKSMHNNRGVQELRMVVQEELPC